jgi:hypothetical protein
MGQNPIAATIAVNPNGKATPLLVDKSGLQLTSTGGLSSSLNVTAAAPIKASAGRIARVVINNPGSAGNLTINDSATTGAAAAANQIFTAAFGSLAAGQVIALEFPCAHGITLSAIPTGGVVGVFYA